ncbi:MAG: hypothetical protein LBT97_05950 [Planctomycetota bacterium]|jgi:uncharacterized protein involved in exopolysaccharide biosynthesis|nr:hypothetical protein [Planctomycetota bacterium]
MDLTVKGIASTILRYKASLLLFSLYLALGFALYLRFAKKTYESTAEILVRFGQEQLASSSVSSMDSRIYITRREQEIQNEIRILTSADTILSVAKVIAGPDAPEGDYLALRDYIQNNLEASGRKNSDIVTASFRFPDPFVARAVLNLIIEQYQIHHSVVYFNSSELDLVKGKMSLAHEEYAAALIKMNQFEITSRLYDSAQILDLVSSVETQKQALNDLRSEYIYTRQKRDKFQETLDTLPKEILFIEREVHNSLRDDFRGRLSELLVQRDGLLTRYKADSHTIQNLQREIDNLVQLIAAEPERLTGEKEIRPNESYTMIHNMIMTLNPEVDALKARIDVLEKQIEDMESSLARANENKSEYALLSRNVELKKGIYDQFYQDYIAAIGKQDAQTNSITNASVIAQPSLDVIPVKPNRRRFIALAVALLFFGNLFILSVQVFTDSTISTPEQAANVLNRQVVGVFGGLSRKGLDGKGGDGKVERSFERQRSGFRQLYIRLTQAERPNVILFTASAPGGDNLALVENFAAFARENQQRSVAMIDYVPGGRYANDDAGAGAGVPEVMVAADPEAGAAPEKTVAEKTVAAEALEAGGPVPSRSFLGVDAFQRSDDIDIVREKGFIEDLLKTYDLVAINYAPLQESPILIALSDFLDWVVYRISAENTNRYQASSAIRSLQVFGFSNIGLILTDRKFHIPAFLYRFL